MLGESENSVRYIRRGNSVKNQRNVPEFPNYPIFTKNHLAIEFIKELPLVIPI